MKNARVGGRRLHLFGLRLRRRRALLSNSSLRAAEDGQAATASIASSSTPSWTAATPCPPTAPAIWNSCSRRCASTTPARSPRVNGRYYAMDRDRRWERIAKAFNAMVFGDGEGGKYVDPVQGMKDSYNKGVTDEFVDPVRVRRQARRAAGHHSRRRFLHLLQLPRRPRAPDHPRPHPQQRPERERRPRSSRRRRPRRDHSARPRAQEPALRLHDAVRQEFQSAGRHSAGIDGQHSGQRHGHRRICATCASPKPRSTRTSPTSSTAASSSRFPAKTACWCRRPRSPPTT